MENSSPFFSNEVDRTQKTVTCPEWIVAIVTDSVTQVQAEFAQQLPITVVPLSVNPDGQRYPDGFDLKPTELHRRIRLKKVMPTTTGPFS